AALPTAPVRPGLFVNLEILAPQSPQDLPEPPHQPRVLRPPLLGDDVTVGLQKHSRPIVPEPRAAFKPTRRSPLWSPSPKTPIFVDMHPKQRAAQAALTYLHDGMIVGLGTGSTADFF